MPDTEITAKNTKTEILDALNAALKRARDLERDRLNPEKKEKERVEKKAIETATKAVEQNIFSKDLNDKFNDLQTAIAAGEARLQELYGVDRELLRLALAIEAGKERLSELEAQKLEKSEDAKKNAERLNAEFAQKNAELLAEYDAQAKKLKLDRTRESEEYQYNLVRKREKENNAWADEKAARELDLSRREERAAALLAEADGKTEYIRSLEEKVNGIPELLESAKAAEAAKTSEALRREHEYKTTLAEKDYQSAIARAEDKAAYLGKELDGANKSVAALQNKLDKAYTEMRDLATKTVESAGGVKIIGNTENKG
ncbi:MAG: hypothetical protein LBL83_04535 [Clostridiales bacterium]|jgi:hypothetical protein|nr:hypothetical protein [Clostridiales bacterium]